MTDNQGKRDDVPYKPKADEAEFSSGRVTPSKLEEANDPAMPTVDAETEKKVLRKLDIRIIPTVMWIYLMNMMDRVNIGNGRLFGLEEDLGLKGSQFQIAVSVLFITYCAFEAPSNLIIKKMRPSRYLAGLMIAWGVVATFSAFVNSFASLVACRLLLGLFEAGLFPGVILYLTMFYGKRSIALRMALFYSTSAFSGVLGGLVAYGISFIDGAGGWRAWRWIVLINGIPTIITGLIIPFVLPNSPETAKFLTEDDRRTMVRLQEADQGKATNTRELIWSDVRDGLKDWKLYVFCLAIYGTNTVFYSFSVFLPTIIRGIGSWTNTEVQALTVPVYMAGALLYIANAWYSDRIQRRGYFIIAAIFTTIFGYCLLIANHSQGMSFAGCFFVAMGAYTSGGISLGWLSTNNPRYGKRAISSGLQLTVANAAGIAAPFLFGDNFAPTYYPGYGATIALLCMSASLYTGLLFWFKKENKHRMEGRQDYLLEGKTEQEIEELGERNPRFMYTV